MAPAGRLLAVAALSFLCLQGLWGDSGSALAQSQPPLHRIVRAEANDGGGGGLMPELPPSGFMPMPDLSPSPSGSPRPFVPFLAPAPLAPFFNNSTPKLSGKCTLNFTAVDKLMTTTAVDCFTSFAPFLANVICCPQLQATLTILIGQSSKQTGSLALDPTVANYCLSDVQELLLSQGASDNLHSLCSVHLSNVTEGSCPVSTVDSFESVVDSSKLLEACRKIDSVNECCSQTCQNAINEAAQKISSKDGGLTTYPGSPKVDSCRNVVLRWLSSRLDPQSAKEMLRQISNCNVNGVCPLSFPDTSKVAKECGGTMKNSTACCKAMLTYVAHLQKQSFITNLQALNCASFLGAKLQKMNVSTNVYSSCQITLKDFSLQVGSQESGCLLPSMPSDASFDSTSGISFTCDLNDNIAAPWPSSMQAPSSSCNKSVNIPERPAATSAQNGVNHKNLKLRLLASLVSLLLVLLVQV
ncbi:uncharacterized GPI-anchored protein At1g61900 [Sorghum bicolor]|uniref:Uncharacterized protein n=1 Tax=Sorghum bicolor TaxID=4558 RepID=C5X733_SORBI|nr:uncharacterized GPI-anchored protein At1g61900 [Sorghum bicolor]EER97817.1 hypothetical protein SORBI_3002G002100 [Sorghum bicolor]|eukprot:XP_002461296.1 uncharacterized GPI-anchored protein At1g61900 [Sorghum bicolor]